MKFLFCSLESPGYLYPAIGLARNLAQRGHEAVFASDIQTAGVLANAGLRRIQRGEPEGSSFLVGHWATPSYVAIQVKHIENALRDFEADVLVGQSLTLGPLIVGERRKLPVGLLGFCTYLWPIVGSAGTDRGRARDEARLTWRHQSMLEWMNKARRLFRLPPFPENLSDSPLLGDLFLVRSIPELETDFQFFPERTHLVGSCLWEPDLRDPDLDGWLADCGVAKKPLVYVQHGRHFQKPGFWPKITQAMGGDSFHVAASVGRLDSKVGDIPRNFFVRPNVPQGRVLPRADVVVASANTTAVLGALTAGLPLLLIPLGGEQLDVAELCESSGVAKILDPQHVSAESIRAAVQELLADQRYRQRAGHYAAALAKVDSFAIAADLFEELAATRKPVLRSARSQLSVARLRNATCTGSLGT